MAEEFDGFNSAMVYPMSKAPVWKTVKTAMDSGGLGIRRKKWAAPMTRFSITLVFNNETSANNFVDFYNDQAGSYDSFTWTCPLDSTIYNCIFTDDEITHSYEGPEYHRFEFTLLGEPAA